MVHILSDYILTIDIGGTQIRVATVERSGNIVTKSSIKTEADLGKTSIIERLVKQLKSVIENSNKRSLLAIAAGVAGPTDICSGIMHNPPHLPAWHQFSLKKYLGEQFDCPVFIANDATFAAIGEYRHGFDKKYNNLVYLTISTGIGGGLILGGHPQFGSRGYSGEFGHMLMVPNGPKCDCGGNGCLESLASGSAIARQGIEAVRLSKSTILIELCNGQIEQISAETISKAARLGDETSKSIFEQAGMYLGIGISNLAISLDPDIIVIGGGLSNSLDLMMESVNKQIELLVNSYVGPSTLVVKSKLGDDAGLLGAATYAFQQTDSEG